MQQQIDYLNDNLSQYQDILGYDPVSKMYPWLKAPRTYMIRSLIPVLTISIEARSLIHQKIGEEQSGSD